jgi:hypothetical protein
MWLYPPPLLLMLPDTADAAEFTIELELTTQAAPEQARAAPEANIEATAIEIIVFFI